MEIEIKALDKSAELWILLNEMPEEHPDDIDDLRFHIHAIQNIILARIGQREYLKLKRNPQLLVENIRLRIEDTSSTSKVTRP